MRRFCFDAGLKLEDFPSGWTQAEEGEEPARVQCEQVSGKATRLCYVETVLHALKQRKDLEVGDANSGRLSLDPLGDQRDAARVTVPLTTAEGVDADLIVDMVFVRSDRGLSLGLFIDVVSPFDNDLREQLTATSVGRLSDNLSSG